MGWFGFGRKKKWANVLPMLYPFELEMDYPDILTLDPVMVESNRVSSLPGPLGLRIYFLDQSTDGAAQMVSHGMLKEWGTDLQSLLSEAIHNLEKHLLPDIRPVKLENCQENIVFFEGAGNYTASLVLSDKVFGKFGFPEQDVALAIPHRDFLYFGEARDGATRVKLAELSQELTLSLENEVPAKHLLINTVAIHDPNSKFRWSSIKLN